MKKNLKKVLAASLAATMVMSISVPAFAYTQGTAENGVEIGTDSEQNKIYATDEGTITLTKEYKLTNAGTISPAETFTFSELTCTKVEDAGVGVTITNAPVPTIGSVEYVAGDAGSTTAKRTITITLPEYTAVGIYTYTFTENDGETAGVTYRNEAIKLVVTVLQDPDDDNKVRVAALHTEGESGEKSAEFNNEYSAGSLSVKKTVTGILGDKEKDFIVKVTFTAPTDDTVREKITYSDDGVDKYIDANWTGTTNPVEITLKHDETVTFENIPYGVTYTVVENDYTAEADGEYDVAAYDFDDAQKIINTASENVTITNNKDGFVDTGISLDALPYLMMLGMSGLGALGFAGKRRKEEDEI